MNVTTLILFSLSLSMVACTRTDNVQQPSPASQIIEIDPQTKTQITNTATTPLNDLNLVNAEIPAVLSAAQKGPYSPPVDQTCTALTADVRALDEVLGPDIDAPVSHAKPDLLERGTTAVGNVAMGAFRGVAEGVVPYRRWVRKLTGAERYSKEVADAIAAGTARRAFLKGVTQATGCHIVTTPVQQPLENLNLSGS